jgi:hypothetical protein
MKRKVKVPYLNGLGDFLDENGFNWFAADSNAIIIELKESLVIYKVCSRINTSDINFIGNIEMCKQFKEENKKINSVIQRLS